MPDSTRLTIPVGPSDHALGPESAPVTLLEYGDFECPYCGAAFPVVKELEQRFGDRLRVVFRHFPLTNAHPHAQAAAEAAEWAAGQGAFWAMHDALYRNQKTLSQAQIVRLATELGLDGAGLARALKEHTYFPRVKEDFLGGLQAGVKGTPAFFINDVRHDGPWDTAALGSAIEQAAARPR